MAVEENTLQTQWKSAVFHQPSTIKRRHTLHQKMSKALTITELSTWWSIAYYLVHKSDSLHKMTLSNIWMGCIHSEFAQCIAGRLPSVMTQSIWPYCPSLVFPFTPGRHICSHQHKTHQCSAFVWHKVCSLEWYLIGKWQTVQGDEYSYTRTLGWICCCHRFHLRWRILPYCTRACIPKPKPVQIIDTFFTIWIRRHE